MNEFVTCAKCGWKNPKSEVFCLNCHRILSEVAINEEKARRRQMRRMLRTLFLFLFMVPFVVLGVALSPRTGPIGKTGSAGVARRTAVIFSKLHNAEGQDLEAGRDLTEGQVNAYFKHLRTKSLSFDELSVDLAPDRLHLRVTNKLGPWLKIEPRISRDFTLSVKDGEVVVEKASVGHLPMMWAFRPGSFARFMRSIKDEPELKLLAKAQSITLHEDRLHITFGGE
jgi:hypothetical protein